MTAPQGKRDFRVTPQNWQALTFFLDLQTQWRVVAGAKGLIWLGLDYTAVEALMRMKKVKGKTKMINKMQAMEEAALTVLSGAVLSDADLAWSSGERP